MNRAECQIEPPVVQCPSAEGAVGRMEVEVVYAPPGREVDLTRLQLPGESTVAQAIEASGVRARHRLAADALPRSVGTPCCVSCVSPRLFMT